LPSDTIYSGYNRIWALVIRVVSIVKSTPGPFEANGGRPEPVRRFTHRKLAISTVSNFRSFELTAELSSSSDGGSIMLGYPRQRARASGRYVRAS
ncbi:hypothetical protein K0M31_002962, partial [Melipona bicolor]